MVCTCTLPGLRSLDRDVACRCARVKCSALIFRDRNGRSRIHYRPPDQLFRNSRGGSKVDSSPSQLVIHFRIGRAVNEGCSTAIRGHLRGHDVGDQHFS